MAHFDLSRYHGTRTPRPGASEMAQMIVDEGETIDTLGELYGIAPATIQHELNAAGYSGVTGQPLAPTDLDYELVEALAAIPAPGAWAGDALCAQTDPELFFVDKGQSTREAKLVCSRCPVAADCLDYALAFPTRHDYGIYGGTSPKERRRLRKALEADTHAHQEAS